MIPYTKGDHVVTGKNSTVWANKARPNWRRRAKSKLEAAAAEARENETQARISAAVAAAEATWKNSIRPLLGRCWMGGYEARVNRDDLLTSYHAFLRHEGIDLAAL